MQRLKKKIHHWLQQRDRRLAYWPIHRYLRDFNIDLVLDVGANFGQYASELRRYGYKGRIESFEPIPEVFQSLTKTAAADPLWNTHPFALGIEQESKSFNVNSNIASSSILEIDSSIDSGGVNLDVVNQIQIDVKRLDDLYPSLVQSATNVFMKVDTQGYEQSVLHGGLESIIQMRACQFELSLTPGYFGEPFAEEIIAEVRGLGFTPWWVMDGFQNLKTNQLYQIDVVFAR